ncbi:MAG: BolA family transcriptional regulator [Candidatus Omnitrophica bacterium]|nr:BolA family transcriptional regulator [Candidatus Omnitrophota bacterium]
MLSKDKIEEILYQSINVDRLVIMDDSAKHTGHAESVKSGGGHFAIHIVSDDFIGKTRVQRHKMIYTVLNDYMGQDIHALAIKAQTMAELEQK